MMNFILNLMEFLVLFISHIYILQNIQIYAMSVLKTLYVKSLKIEASCINYFNDFYAFVTQS